MLRNTQYFSKLCRRAGDGCIHRHRRPLHDGYGSTVSAALTDEVRVSLVSCPRKFTHAAYPYDGPSGCRAVPPHNTSFRSETNSLLLSSSISSSSSSQIGRGGGDRLPFISMYRPSSKAHRYHGAKSSAAASQSATTMTTRMINNTDSKRCLTLVDSTERSLTTNLLDKHAMMTDKNRYGYRIRCNRRQSLHTCAQPMQLHAATRLAPIHVPALYPNTINGYSIRHYTRRRPPSAKRTTKAGSGGSEGPLALEQEGSKRLPSSKFMGALGFTVIFLTVASSPMIISAMKQSENMYDELEIEDVIHHQMLTISNDLYKELGSFLNIDQQSSSSDNNNNSSSNESNNNVKDRLTNNMAEIIIDVVNKPALQKALTTLVSRVIESEPFQLACKKLIKTLWDELIHDPETTAQVIQLLNTSIQDERIKQSVQKLVMGLLQDEDIYKELTSMVVRLGEEQDVLEATKDLLTLSAHNALNDPEILDHSMEFATDVVGDDVVQRTSGEALRNTVTYAVKPSLSTFFSIFGVGLVLFSMSAFANARHSAQMGREIDVATSEVARNIGTVLFNAAAKFLALPRRIISRSFSAVLTTVVFPFRWIGDTLRTATGPVVTGTTSVLYGAWGNYVSHPTGVWFGRWVMSGVVATRRMWKGMGDTATVVYVFTTSCSGACGRFLGKVGTMVRAIPSSSKFIEMRKMSLETVSILRSLFLFIAGFG